MKHLATIQTEFLKEARKWDDLTLEEQKGYLSRHPGSKRKLTAKPGQSSVKSEKKNKKERTPKTDIGEKLKRKKKEVVDAAANDTNESSSKLTFDDIAAKLEKKSKPEIQAEIDKLQGKIDKRDQAATRKEQRARGDLDGTSYEIAYERSRPDAIKIQLYKHFLENGKKKLPPDLQKELDDLNDHLDSASKRKERKKQEKAENTDLVGKVITWKSSKNFGKEMTGRVVSVGSGKRGPYAKTDTGWRVPISLITNTKEAPKGEKEKVRVQPKDLVGKEIRWKTKKRPGTVTRRIHGGFFMQYEQQIPGYDAKTGTAGGIVEQVKGQKLVVGGWRIPISLIQSVDGQQFTGWTKDE